MPQPALDFWFDFASTYSYPAAMRIGPLAAAAGITMRFRPFLLGPIFKAQGWSSSPFNIYPAKGRYMWRDLERLCAELALPFRRPDPFPQQSLLATRVALVGLSEDWGDEFCRAVFRAEFADGRRIDDVAVVPLRVRKPGGHQADAGHPRDTTTGRRTEPAVRLPRIRMRGADKVGVHRQRPHQRALRTRIAPL